MAIGGWRERPGSANAPAVNTIPVRYSGRRHELEESAKLYAIELVREALAAALGRRGRKGRRGFALHVDLLLEL